MNKKLESISKYGLELLGVFLTSISIYNICSGLDLPVTGFSGIAIILNRLFGFQIGIVTIILNVPLAILCYKRIGRSFFFHSIGCMVLQSLIVDYICPFIPVLNIDRFLAIIVASVLDGIGYALIYLQNSSTGGTDFIAIALKNAFPHLPFGPIGMTLSGIILITNWILFKDTEGVILALIMAYLVGVINDKVMFGPNSGKMAMIITTRGKEVCDVIDKVTERGTTLVKALGGYKFEEKDMVYCACKAKEMIHIEKAVKDLDPSCFMVIWESNEVHGEGFKVFRI